MKILSYIVDGRVATRTPDSTKWAVKAIEDGVDVFQGQGTGMDLGPYYLGSDEVMPLPRSDIEPLLLACKRTRTPFVLSMGGAGGADHQLNAYLDVVEQIARDNGVKLNIARISGEVSKDYLRKRLREGARARRSIDTPRISEYLTEQDVEDATRIQAQMGAEPIMEALKADGIDGVITGRALDVGIHMAAPLLNGIDRATAAHVGKIVECASMSAEPTGPFEGAIADIQPGSFTVRPTHPDYRCTIQSVSGHSLYERENPFEERNPGGVLDVTQAVYEQLDEHTVRCSGGVWNDVPYTVKLEGARKTGYQSATIAGIRDSRMVDRIDEVMEMVRDRIARTTDEDVDVAFHVFGRDGVLGLSEPLRLSARPHELGVLLVVTAPTQELADLVINTGRLGLFMGQFEGRRSTAGNTAIPTQRMCFPLGPSFVFNIWHLLPLDDPCEPFPYEIVEFG